MIESQYVTGVYNPVGSYEGKDPADEPTELVESEWVFTCSDLFPWDECSGEFHSRRLLHKEHSIIIYECDKCEAMRTLEELQIAAAEVYAHDWESICKREIVR